MKKKNFVTLFLSTVGGILVGIAGVVALLCLIPELMLLI